MAMKKIGQIVDDDSYDKSREYFKDQSDFHRSNFIALSSSYEKYLMVISTSILFFSFQYLSKINSKPDFLILLKISWIILIVTILLNLIIIHIDSLYSFEQYTYNDYIYRIKILKGEIQQHNKVNENSIVHNNKIQKYHSLSKWITILRIITFTSSLILSLIYVIENIH